ncbi:MAG: AAC(3) family N-acetyltransferase [Verrucomicrobia bacterium]|nr:AAC(3) family N-acetyltransferase [Verrucomicrobiota bacterium]MBU1856230.1 AAC(3) family N-acetyltransferase [Verrucomicrobiota bacterium]
MIQQAEIEKGLKTAGLKKGATVILHSSLASLGQVAGGAETVVNAFLHVLDSTGTLVVPTFGALGAITDAVKAHPKAVQSLHPLAGVAAIGAKAKAICRDHWQAGLAHEKDTPYMRIAELGGYVCLLGVDQDRNTMLHSVEEVLRLPYLKTTAAKTFDTPGGQVTKSWPFFPGPHRDFIGLDRLFRESLPASGGALGDQGGKMKIVRIGHAVVRLIKGRDLMELALEAGRQDPAFVLCANPNCADCVAQRADLWRARFAGESFHLAVSTLLAGRYLPEIIEQCARAGIRGVELDILEGMPVELMAADKLKTTVAALREGKLEVTALRARAVGMKPSVLIERARKCGVARVVLPLAERAEEALAAARDQGIALSFFNTMFDSEQTSAMLLRLKGKGWNPGFTFSATGFARLGEKPFLGSYKKKLRRFVDQLDVEDCLFDGTPQPLAHGNAEIKELISILRCASFDGWLVLGAGNRGLGSLSEMAGRFVGLLDAM